MLVSAANRRRGSADGRGRGRTRSSRSRTRGLGFLGVVACDVLVVWLVEERCTQVPLHRELDHLVEYQKDRDACPCEGCCHVLLEVDCLATDGDAVDALFLLFRRRSGGGVQVRVRHRDPYAYFARLRPRRCRHRRPGGADAWMHVVAARLTSHDDGAQSAGRLTAAAAGASWNTGLLAPT